MGALHRGHLALVRAGPPARPPRGGVDLRQSRRSSRRNEDFASYPRGFDADLTALAAAKVDLVWAPTGRGRCIRRALPPASRRQGAAKAGLEDKFRPHFFGGVATVVAKLFTQVRARLRAVRREGLPATARRHPDGQGSRSAGQGDRRADGAREGRPRAVVAQRLPVGGRARGRADALSRAARRAPRASRQGEPIAHVLDEGARRDRRAPALRSIISRRATPLTLAPIASRKDGPIRLLVAAKIGKTRLIDNIGCSLANASPSAIFCGAGYAVGSFRPPRTGVRGNSTPDECRGDGAPMGASCSQYTPSREGVAPLGAPSRRFSRCRAALSDRGIRRRCQRAPRGGS